MATILLRRASPAWIRPLLYRMPPIRGKFVWLAWGPNTNLDTIRHAAEADIERAETARAMQQVPQKATVVSEQGISLEETVRVIEQTGKDAEELVYVSRWDWSWLSPAEWLRHGLEQMHETGIPWWLSIVMVTVVARVSFFPLMAVGKRHSTLMRNLNETVLKPLTLRAKLLKGQEQLEAQQEVLDVMHKHGTGPFKAMWPMAQAPVFMTFFFTLKSGLPEGVQEGGLSWFMDLSIPDPWYGLPLINAAFFLATIEFAGGDGMVQKGSGTSVWIMRALSVGLVPLGAGLNRAVLLFWLTSSATSMALTPLYNIEAVKTYFNIPDPVVVEKAPPKPPKRAPTTYAVPPKKKKKKKKK